MHLWLVPQQLNSDCRMETRAGRRQKEGKKEGGMAKNSNRNGIDARRTGDSVQTDEQKGK